MKRYLGVDLGGCMSGTTAFCLIEGDGENFSLLSCFKEPKHKEPQACANFLRQTLLEANADHIGIDAPLSLPAKLLDPLCETVMRQGNGEITNPYLYRYTDYYLFKTFGLRPMPPAGDRIGRLTARMIELLSHEEIVPIKERIIEVYPKQIAHALGFSDYKKEPHRLLEAFGSALKTYDVHQIDAFLAAYATMMIDDKQTTPRPKEAVDGWCHPYLHSSKKK